MQQVSPMNAILKLKHTLKNSIDTQEESIPVLQQILQPDGDLYQLYSQLNIITLNGEEILLSQYPFMYTISSAESNCSYTVSHSENSNDLIITKSQKVDGEVITDVEQFYLNVDYPAKLIAVLADVGIDVNDILSGVASGMHLNRTIQAINDQFLSSETIDLNALHNQLVESQQLITDDQRSLYTQLISSNNEGKVHKMTWLHYMSKVVNTSEQAANNETYELDTTDPFTKTTFLNTVKKIIEIAITAVFVLLASIFKALAFVFNMVFSVLGKLVDAYNDYNQSITVADDDPTGRIKGPIIACECNPEYMVVKALDDEVYRYVIPGLETILWGQVGSRGWADYKVFMNTYVNCNVDPARLRNYLFNNIRLNITDDPDQPGHKLGFIRPIKTLFDQHDPEWCNVINDEEYSDVTIDAGDFYTLSSNQETAKVLIGCALTCAYLAFTKVSIDSPIFDVETQWLSNFTDRADMNHVDIIDENGNIITVTDTPSIGNGSYKISRIWDGISTGQSSTEGFIAGLGQWIDYTSSLLIGTTRYHAMALNGLNSIIRLLTLWPVVRASGAENSDLLELTVNSGAGLRTVSQLLNYGAPSRDSDALIAMRSLFLSIYGTYDSGVNPNFQSGNYYSINKKDPMYMGPISDTSAGVYRYYLMDVEELQGHYVPASYLLPDWNKMDDMITGWKFELPDPAVQTIVRILAVTLVAIAAVLVTVKVAKARFKKWTRLKQISEGKKLEQLKKQATDASLSSEDHKAAIKQYNSAIFKYNFKAKLFGWGSYDAANNWFNSPGDSAGTISSLDTSGIMNDIKNLNGPDESTSLNDILAAINPNFIKLGNNSND